MSRALLLLAHPANRRLMAGALGRAHDVEAPDPSVERAASLLDGDWDLCVVDPGALERLEHALRTRRRGASTVRPVLLVAPRQAARAVSALLGDVIDEWLPTPVDPVELRARVEVLFRLRRLSLVAAERAHLEGVLLAARTFEHELCNTLVATVGYTDVLAKDQSLPEAARRRAQRAHKGAADAVAIIRHVLSLTDAGPLRVTDWGDTGQTTIDVSAA